MAANSPLSPAASSALSAFLRGAERRALVVAELQTGDPESADHAVEASMRAFAGYAPALVMADWPTRFWGLLCSNPQLRAPAAGHWTPAFSHLPQMAAGERLALLLRIGAGLDEVAAAAALGTDVDAYRQALADACPLDAQGYPDAAAWRALAEQVQSQVRDLPEARMRQLARSLEPVVAMAPPSERTVPAAVAAASSRSSTRGSARSRRWWWFGLPALLLILLAAGWWYSRGAGRVMLADEDAPRDGVVTDVNPVHSEELRLSSPAPSPAANDSHAAADAAMLADPDIGLVREADFYAWFAAGGPVPVDESQAQPTRPAPATAALGLETADGDE